MTVEEIREAIADKEIEVVSFDIFDTLLIRPFYAPTDLFDLLDAKVTDLLGTIDHIDFKKHRMEAEHIARRRLTAAGKEDVTLDEIYQVLEELLGLPVEQREIIKSWEIEMELCYCRPRKFAQELFNLALKCGKRVIIASDMYLSRDVVADLLDRNGYQNYEKLYLSSEMGLTKATGSMYDHIVKELGIASVQIMHIGDNENSDIRRARQRGWQAVFLPKCIQMLMNHLPDSHSGEIYQKAYGESFLNRQDVLKDFLGIRVMLAVVANHIFDNPFRGIAEASDFDGDPALLGYGPLGMKLFAIAHWLCREMDGSGFSQICFIARDGYLPMRAYEKFRHIYPDMAKSCYAHFTRTSVLPLRIRNKQDWLSSLAWGASPVSKSPKDICEWFEDFLTEDQGDRCEEICEKHGFPYRKKFASVEAWDTFIRFFSDAFYRQEKFDAYRAAMKDALEPLLGGKTATFDSGYHYRVDETLKQSLGFDITPYCLHIMNDVALIRARRNVFPLKTFYGCTPVVSGMVREVLISEPAPTCEKLCVRDGKVVPIFAAEEHQPGEEMQKILQENALAFVDDMLTTFGEDIQYLPYLREDAALALDYFLLHPKKKELELFEEIAFEENFGQGKYFKLTDFWLWQIQQSKRKANHEIEEDPRFRFPEEAVPAGTRLIIYGGGVVGKTYLSQTQRSTSCKVIALCDREPEMTGITGVTLMTPVQLAGMEIGSYDMVLIAVEREQIADSISRELQELGILGKKIRWVNPARTSGGMGLCI